MVRAGIRFGHWAQVVHPAHDRLAAERDSLERSRQEFEAETDEALVWAEKPENERDEARRQAAEVQSRIACGRFRASWPLLSGGLRRRKPAD
jgi:hypothetical protein